MSPIQTQRVGEALELAERLKAEGKFDFFRGQTGNWPLRSSFQRRGKEDQQKAILWLDRFRSWVSHTEGLWAVSADVDQTIAVAQHYGIPTDFLDITTEPRVAAFF